MPDFRSISTGKAARFALCRRTSHKTVLRIQVVQGSLRNGQFHNIQTPHSPSSEVKQKYKARHASIVDYPSNNKVAPITAMECVKVHMLKHT